LEISNGQIVSDILVIGGGKQDVSQRSRQRSSAEKFFWLTRVMSGKAAAASLRPGHSSAIPMMNDYDLWFGKAKKKGICQ
jgi:hypothetical protein